MQQEEALKKLQSTELSILKIIADFCRENSITWWLDGGTCLGAMRHQGFIPWDDDIDIGMMREDYDKFCSLAESGLPSGYSIHTSRNSSGYAAMFAKVYKDGTRFENQEGRDASSSMGIFVDVFPYDRLYEDAHLRRKQVRAASIAQKRSYLYHSETITVPHKGALGCLEKAGCVLLHHIERLVIKNSLIYQDLFDSCIANNESGEVSDDCLTLAWPNMEPIQVADVLPASEAEFEGSLFPVPHNTEKYLTIMYGEWRVIPAPEDRHTHLPLLLDFGDGEIWSARK